MKKSRRTKETDQWLIELGKRLDALIKENGYSSPYEFWVEECDETISRASLNYILKGQVDAKISTLRKLSQLLDIELNDLLKF